MLAVSVKATKIDKPIKKGFRIRSILRVLRIKKVKIAANNPTTAPNQRKGLEYHHKANAPTKIPKITEIFLELTAGLIFPSFQ